MRIVIPSVECDILAEPGRRREAVCLFLTFKFDLDDAKTLMTSLKNIEFCLEVFRAKRDHVAFFCDDNAICFPYYLYSKWNLADCRLGIYYVYCCIV